MRILSVLGVFVIIVACGVIYSGLYPIGADNPHTALTYWLLETLRDRSVQRAAKDITVPNDLNNAERLLKGGPDYNEMCAQCHLKPGVSNSDFSLGLYPKPPNLSKKQGDANPGEDEAKRRFWIIKHGIKASGMPAWKYGHDDERIWNMVAFISRLPELKPVEYQIITAR